MFQAGIDVQDWKFKQTESGRTIVGNFVIKNGTTVIAKQSFNEEYATSKILFSSELMIEIERINQRIVDEITKNFIG